jgi:hypothetical protein
MPSGGNNIFDAERFATLVGRFDLGNPSEAEAINAARVIRRTLAEHNLRFVDAMGRADVMQALDTQFQPVREDSEELKTAFAEITKYAELATQYAETITDLRRRLASTPRVMVERAGLVNGGVVALAVVLALALMLMAEFH